MWMSWLCFCQYWWWTDRKDLKSRRRRERQNADRRTGVEILWGGWGGDEEESCLSDGSPTEYKQPDFSSCVILEKVFTSCWETSHQHNKSSCLLSFSICRLNVSAAERQKDRKMDLIQRQQQQQHHTVITASDTPLCFCLLFLAFSLYFPSLLFASIQQVDRQIYLH